MDAQPPPQHPLYAPPPLQNPNPNFQHNQQYPNPNPNPENDPNFQHNQQYPNPNPNPENAAAAAAAAAAAVVSYGPHGGYSVDPTASAGAGAAPYYYCHGYGCDPSQYYGVYPNSYGQIPPVPSNGINSTVSPHAVPSQKGPKSNYRRGSKKGFRMTKVAQPLLCGVCKIACDTQEVLNLHKQGKKHKKNLQKLQESITPKSQRAQMTANGAEKKGTKTLVGVGPGGVAQQAHCEVCKIHCDTEAVLNIHEQGKKHKKNLQKLQSSEESKDAEPSNAVQPAYCATCNVFCNTQVVLSIHNVGKKHKRNLLKLQNPIAPNPQSSHFTADNAENKEARVSEQENALGFKGRKRREVTVEDMETKRRKILDGGAAPSEVMVCSICNVVVNSWVVYDAHIAGSKHAAMVKNQQGAAIVECEASADSESLVAPILASDC